MSVHANGIKLQHLSTESRPLQLTNGCHVHIAGFFVLPDLQDGLVAIAQSINREGGILSLDTAFDGTGK